jgi:L-methionine (R)-S-oxide reductase
MTELSRDQLIDNIRIAIAGTNEETEVLRIAAEMIDAFSEGFNWTGFYIMKDGVLEVGPYIGPETPHTRIELSNGICGAAAREKKSIIVPDVAADERFLACSLTTRSEIVVPLKFEDQIIGEIDVDSNQPSFFGPQDQEMLERIAALVVERLVAIRR